MCGQNAAYLGEVLRIRVKKLKRNLRENYSKNAEIAIKTCKFSNFFRGSMSPDPLKLFLFLNQLQISSAKKKYAEIYVEIMGPSSQNFSLRHWAYDTAF